MKAKKILSILLVFTLVLSVFGMGAVAADTEDEIEFEIESCSKDMIKQVYSVLPLEREQNQKLASPTSTSYKFYNYISAEAKAVYDAFMETDAGLTSTPQGTITADLSECGRNYTKEKLQYAVYYACAAITDDHPEYQWLLSAPFKVNYKKSTNTVTLKTNMNEVPYKNWNQISDEHTALLNAVEKFEVKDADRYSMVKDIHDKLCCLASYSTNLSNSTSAINSKVFYPSSALLYPYQTVCDGYSKAFKMLCDANGIPCIVVCGYGYTQSIFGIVLVGGGHAWNYVQMEDGNWYAVDLTWADQDSSIIYDYFLVGSSTKDSSGNSFGVTHKPTGDRFVNTYLTYPALSARRYEYKEKPEVTEPDKTPDSTPDTPDKLLFGDLNADGKLTVVDAKWVLNFIAGTFELNDTQRLVADINRDGKITIVDAKYILQCVAGLREYA